VATKARATESETPQSQMWVLSTRFAQRKRDAVTLKMMVRTKVTAAAMPRTPAIRIDCETAKDDGEGEQCPISEEGVSPFASDFLADLKIDFAFFAAAGGDDREDEDIDDEQNEEQRRIPGHPATALRREVLDFACFQTNGREGELFWDHQRRAVVRDLVSTCGEEVGSFWGFVGIEGLRGGHGGNAGMQD
jgi:hypothetical protein